MWSDDHARTTRVSLMKHRLVLNMPHRDPGSSISMEWRERRRKKGNFVSFQYFDSEDLVDLDEPYCRCMFSCHK
jgi:hypothetical protein